MYVFVSSNVVGVTLRQPSPIIDFRNQRNKTNEAVLLVLLEIAPRPGMDKSKMIQRKSRVITISVQLS
jgi:hypothetical protein